MAKIRQLEEEHKGKWVAIEVTASENGEPLEGHLIAVADTREEILEKAPPHKDKIILIKFIGPPLKKGYVAAFLWLR